MTTSTRLPGTAGSPNLVTVEDVLRQHLGARAVRLAVVAMSRDDNPKAVVMATESGSTSPVLAVKVALTAGAAESVRAEAAALQGLAALDPGLVGGTVPRVVALHDGTAGTLLVTTVSHGRPLSVDYHQWHHTASRRRVEADFEAAAAWLRELHPVEVPPAPEPDWAALLRGRWPDDGLGEEASRVCRVARDRLGELDAGHVTHGDFWCGNILRSGRRVTGVVDWEHTRFGSDPLWDRVRFALAYTLYLDRHTRAGAPVHGHAGLRAGAWGEPLRFLLRGQGWYADLVAAFLTPGLGSGAAGATWRDALVVGLGQVATTADQPEFARAHALLLAEVGS
jgi:aminoglycoside phosphotransferase (APT) family kinase protein